MEIVRALYQLVAIAIPYNIVLAALVVHDGNCYDGSVVLVRCLLQQLQSGRRRHLFRVLLMLLVVG